MHRQMNVWTHRKVCIHRTSHARGSKNTHTKQWAQQCRCNTEKVLNTAALKITTCQRSLTVVTVFAIAKKLHRMVTMTA